MAHKEDVYSSDHVIQKLIGELRDDIYNEFLTKSSIGSEES